MSTTISSKPKPTKEKLLIRAFKKKPLMHTMEIVKIGISRQYLSKLLNKGTIEKVERGLYKISQSPISEYCSLARSSVLVPHGVICLLSALQFYKLTTQMPFEVWMAVKDQSRKPQAGNLSLKIIKLSPLAYQSGIEEHSLDGVKVKIYSPAKTIADCFKFRHKIGLDIAIEALKDYLKLKLGSIDEIWEYAKICRVMKIIRPYLESLVYNEERT